MEEDFARWSSDLEDEDYGSRPLPVCADNESECMRVEDDDALEVVEASPASSSATSSSISNTNETATNIYCTDTGSSSSSSDDTSTDSSSSSSSDDTSTESDSSSEEEWCEDEEEDGESVRNPFEFRDRVRETFLHSLPLLFVHKNSSSSSHFWDLVTDLMTN